jgi:hypothetical protein
VSPRDRDTPEADIPPRGYLLGQVVVAATTWGAARHHEQRIPVLSVCRGDAGKPSSRLTRHAMHAAERIPPIRSVPAGHILPTMQEAYRSALGQRYRLMSAHQDLPWLVMSLGAASAMATASIASDR